jgi:NAD(P)-dependent dehydrogenase (short-subunit alcohol dehydrogenase family)
MSEFDGKVAIVTGASSGIGRCTAELLAREGARVAVFARSKDKLTDLASDRVLPVAGDVRHLEDVERLFSLTESHFGHVDVLINNAGMIDPAPLIETTFDEWQEMFAVNVRRVSHLPPRIALDDRAAQRRDRECLVDLRRPRTEKFPGWVSYCASKAR